MKNFTRKSSLILLAVMLFMHTSAQDIKQLSMVLSWKDNSTLLMAGFDKDKRIYKEYNIITGVTSEVEKPSEEKRAVVFIKDGDIVYSDENGVEKRVTKTDCEEKNPEISPDGKKIAFTRDNDLYSVSVDGSGE
ncbi:MAG: hypothetical protein QMB82_06775, partial [Bacteroidales bacterium]